MSLASLLRNHHELSLTIANGAAVSEAADLRKFSMGVVQMPAGWTAASIGFQVSNTLSGTYQPLYDKNGNLVQISSPAVSQAYALPAEVAGCHFVKLWSQDGAGSGTNQGADRALTLTLKS